MSSWPEWAQRLAWSVGAIGGAYALGVVIRAAVGPRLAQLVSRTTPRWDNVLLHEVGRRLPLWSVLIGAYFSLFQWHLPADTHQTILRTIQAVGIASITLALAAVLSRLLVDYGSRASVPVSGLSQNVVRVVVTLVGGLMIIRSFGYDITPMLTVLGVGGLTVALALQEPLSNFFAGIFVSLAGQVRIGDHIRLDSGAEGQVVDFKWRATRLRQPSDVVIDVPNSKLAQAILTNYSQSGGELGMSVEFIVDPASDLAVVEREALHVARQVIGSVAGAARAAEPVVRFTAMTAVGIHVAVGLRATGFTDQALLRHELIKALHARLADSGVALVDTRVARASAAPTPPRGA